jgi:hypothetical protein
MFYDLFDELGNLFGTDISDNKMSNEWLAGDTYMYVISDIMEMADPSVTVIKSHCAREVLGSLLNERFNLLKLLVQLKFLMVNTLAKSCNLYRIIL